MEIFKTVMDGLVSASIFAIKVIFGVIAAAVAAIVIIVTASKN